MVVVVETAVEIEIVAEIDIVVERVVIAGGTLLLLSIQENIGMSKAMHPPLVPLFSLASPRMPCYHFPCTTTVLFSCS